MKIRLKTWNFKFYSPTLFLLETWRDKKSDWPHFYLPLDPITVRIFCFSYCSELDQSIVQKNQINSQRGIGRGHFPNRLEPVPHYLYSTNYIS